MRAAFSILLAFAAGGTAGAGAEEFRLAPAASGTGIAWSGASAPGICRFERKSDADGEWTPAPSAYSPEATGFCSRLPGGSRTFVRCANVDVSPANGGFTNFVHSYGVLETVAGTGYGQTDGENYWQDGFEDGPAVWATLSRPHFALADGAGNVYVVDKNSHSVLRVDTNGVIRTHVGGFNGEGPAAATNLQLNFPNSLWVRADGTVYVLDTDNGRVRRVGTDGTMATLFLARASGEALDGGRGLWVSDDETLAYFCNETRVRTWTAASGLSTLASGFVELGNLYVEPDGHVLVCDRGAHAAYRIAADGSRTAIAGNGTAAGGGDGQPVLETGLNGLRGIWPVPTGGYLLLTHDGCQLWYADSAGIAHLLLNGAGGGTHAGDGRFFYGNETPKISEGRSVALDAAGNVLLCESDWGYVRRIRFERLAP